MHSILVVDDELSIRESFSLILEGKYRLLLAASGEAALKTVADQKVDMVYLDIRMPGMDGLETLKRLKEIDPEPEIIMVTAVNEVHKASQAIRYGARDYVVKPFDVDHITKLTDQILRKKALLEEGSQIQRKTGKESYELIGQTEKITDLLKSIDKIKKDGRVLVTGEAGTEKEIVAHLIHEKTRDSASPYKVAHLSPAVSIAEIKALFLGWEKGGSSVALAAKSGLLEQSKDGTLFIHNLESLPEEIFKIISSAEFSRQGGSAKLPLRARLIGSAGTDLAGKNKAVFDFFSETHLQIPPLRERASDIPLLINHFLERYNQRYGKQVSIQGAASEALTNYSWPGNRQELESLIEQLVITSTTEQIALEDLPFHILVETAKSAGSNFLSAFEKEYIQSVFEQSGKNKGKTAALLGINPVLLETKLS